MIVDCAAYEGGCRVADVGGSGSRPKVLALALQGDADSAVLQDRCTAATRMPEHAALSGAFFVDFARFPGTARA
jgi:hypothetical protein